MFIARVCHACKVVVVHRTAAEAPISKVAFTPDPNAIACVKTLADMFTTTNEFRMFAKANKVSVIRTVKILTACDLRSCKEAVDNFIDSRESITIVEPIIDGERVVLTNDSWIVSFVRV